MKYSKLTLTIIGLLLSCFSLAAAAKAEGSRSYIAPSGSDNRPCSRSQPCRTFDGALPKTDEGGEIIALETATYDPATITKSITLTAAPTADVVIRATNGTAVTVNNLSAVTVVLRGLKLSGPGKTSNSVGVSLFGGTSGTIVLIENCVISGFGTGIKADDNDSARLGVTDSVIRNNHTGLSARFNGTAAMGAFATRTRFEQNEIGALCLGGKPIVVKESLAAGNNIGFLTEQGGHFILASTMVARNSVGVEVRSGTVVLASSIITGNGTGVESQGTVQSRGDNIVRENEVDLSLTTPIVALAGQ